MFQLAALESEINELELKEILLSQDLSGNKVDPKNRISILRRRDIHLAVIETLDSEIRRRIEQQILGIKKKIAFLKEVRNHPEDYIGSVQNGEIVYKKR